MKRKCTYAAEARLFWCVSSEARQAIREDKPEQVIDDCVDELEVIGINTDWPRLKVACAALIITLSSAEAIAACGF
jgi:hypothetical protein